MKQKTYHLAECILEDVEQETGFIIDEEYSWPHLRRKIEQRLDEFIEEVLDELEANRE